MRFGLGNRNPAAYDPGKQQGQECDASLAAPVPDFAAHALASPFSRDRYSRDETIDLPTKNNLGEFNLAGKCARLRRHSL